MSVSWDALLAEEAAPPEFVPGTLATKFVQPPFTVLDTRQGSWQERRRSWLSLGIKSELGRGADLLSLSPAEQARARWGQQEGTEREGTTYGRSGSGSDLAGGMRASIRTRQAMERQREPGYRYDERGAMRSGEGRALEPESGNFRTDYGAYTTDEEQGATGGTSIFDPVLCELAYRWWAPEGGSILDPFAGGSVRGIVAAKLGHAYTGIDLSGGQLVANREQAQAILAPEEPMPRWIEGDSTGLQELLPAGELYDMVFTCPPYHDLEVYSDDPRDLSVMSWEQFTLELTSILHSAAERLRDQRFAVVVVSEIRDSEGYCKGLVPATIEAARVAGLRLYNEAVLINAAGSLPLRVTKYMEASRKLGRAHQNVLCFLKGKPPRGWSYDRAAPPSPQLDLHLLEEPTAPPAGPLQSLQIGPGGEEWASAAHEAAQSLDSPSGASGATSSPSATAAAIGSNAPDASDTTSAPGSSAPRATSESSPPPAGDPSTASSWSSSSAGPSGQVSPSTTSMAAAMTTEERTSNYGSAQSPAASEPPPSPAPTAGSPTQAELDEVEAVLDELYPPPEEPEPVAAGDTLDHPDGYLVDRTTGEVLEFPAPEPAPAPEPTGCPHEPGFHRGSIEESACAAGSWWPGWPSVIPAGPPGSGATSVPPTQAALFEEGTPHGTERDPG